MHARLWSVGSDAARRRGSELIEAFGLGDIIGRPVLGYSGGQRRGLENTGITNKSLRALMTGLLGNPYSMNQASYDLGLLARNGLITRIPPRNLYALTADGLRFAIFYTKVHDRVLRPLMAGGQPQAPPPLRAALRVIDGGVTRRIAAARLPAVA